MKHYLVTNFHDKSEKYIVKEKSGKDAIKHVSNYYGFSAVQLNAYVIDELINSNEGILTIKLY